MIGAFAKRNPHSSRSELTEVGNLVADFSATAARLSPAARKRLIARKARFKELIVQIAAEPEAAQKPLEAYANSPCRRSNLSTGVR